MHTKFHAIPIRFGHSNSDFISASSDFQKITDFNTLSYLSSIWTKLEINLLEYSHKTYIHSNISQQATYAYLSNSMNSYAPKWNDQLEIYLGLLMIIQLASFNSNIVTPDFKDKIGCRILCVPRNQSHT